MNMGWARGSELACEVYDLVRQYIPKEKKQGVAEQIYELFTDLDADDWDGTSDLEIDAGVNQEDEEE